MNSFYILGPSATGKSTIIKNLPDTICVSDVNYADIYNITKNHYLTKHMLSI